MALDFSLLFLGLYCREVAIENLGIVLSKEFEWGVTTRVSLNPPTQGLKTKYLQFRLALLLALFKVLSALHNYVIACGSWNLIDVAAKYHMLLTLLAVSC